MKGLFKRFQTFSFLPDWVLIKQAKMGEKEAFGKLYEKYLDRLYRYVFYRTGQKQEIAEDVVQTVFVKAWEKLGTFKEGSFQAWLYTITRNTLIDHVRGHTKHEQLDETVIDEKAQVEQHVATKLQTEQIMHQMKYLTEEQQEVLLLRFVNELSHREIAQTLGKREDAVRALQYRALQELKRRLG